MDISTIPRDLDYEFAINVDYYDLAALCKTNKRYSRLCDSQRFWYLKALKALKDTKFDINEEKWKSNPLAPRLKYLQVLCYIGTYYLGSEKFVSPYELAVYGGKHSDIKLLRRAIEIICSPKFNDEADEDTTRPINDRLLDYLFSNGYYQEGVKFIEQNAQFYNYSGLRYLIINEPEKAEHVKMLLKDKRKDDNVNPYDVEAVYARAILKKKLKPIELTIAKNSELNIIKSKYGYTMELDNGAKVLSALIGKIIINDKVAVDDLLNLVVNQAHIAEALDNKGQELGEALNDTTLDGIMIASRLVTYFSDDVFKILLEYIHSDKPVFKWLLDRYSSFNDINNQDDLMAYQVVVYHAIFDFRGFLIMHERLTPELKTYSDDYVLSLCPEIKNVLFFI